MLPRPSTAVPLVTTANRAALEGVGVDVVGIGHDLAAGLGHARRVGRGQGILVLAGHQALHRQFTGAFGMQFKSSLIVSP